MEKTNLDDAKELPQTNTGEKRKREGESRHSNETEDVIFVGDAKALKEIVLSKRQAFDVESDRNLEGSLKKEEAEEELERSKQYANFNDFDKLREESGFAVGQTWALYDTDGMPRLYARIRGVSVPGFGVSVTWLEPDPDDEEKKRRENKLPVCLGKFRLGRNQSIKDRRRFSHLVHCDGGSSAGKFSVYPRKGETWAVFKGRFKPASYGEVEWPHPCQYQFVQVLSEHDHRYSSVGFLHKAKGFSSVFCHFTEEIESCYIQYYSHSPNEFSHCVPLFKITGNEAEGMPRGAYELDPAALPENIKEIDVPLHLLSKPTVPNSDNSQCVHFASKGITYQTGQIWSFCSGDDYLPRYYGKIEKITFVQAFEQDPVVKLHVGRLKATTTKGVTQWIDKKMPIGCGNFRARKVLEIFTDLDVFSRLIHQDSSGDVNDFSIMPRTGDVWAIYRNWSKDIEVNDLQSQTYDLVEVLDDKLDLEVLLLAPAGLGSLYIAATEQGVDGADVSFTIPKSEMLRFSHQIPTSKVTKELHGAMQEVYEPNIDALPINLIL